MLVHFVAFLFFFFFTVPATTVISTLSLHDALPISTLRIGQQIAEALILAKGKRYPGVDADIVELLQQVGIDKPVLRARQYPQIGRAHV